MARKIFNRLFRSKVTGNIIIAIGSIILVYLLCSIYFINHFFINTKVNGVKLSLKNHSEANDILSKSIENYNIKIVGRDGRSEAIDGKDIEIVYKENDIKEEIKKHQSSIMWISSLITKKEYYIDGIIQYNEDKVSNIVNNLDIVTKDIIDPINAEFKYSDGIYQIEPEIYGNKIDKEKLIKVISEGIYIGISIIDLDKNKCYENPMYISTSDKTIETEKLLNKYVSTKITYLFGENREELNGNTIKDWLSVNENLDVVINEKALNEYMLGLGNKYNTVGMARNFKTSTGKVVEVEGGDYGWKINSLAEKKLLLEDIKLGASMEKEPIYTQKALYRDEDDIGNTYVEINISKQYLWFYKDGKVVAEGGIVTGDPRKGYSTALGTYMINYKQKDAVLRGPGYEAKVNYWMPFNGNIGIHDANWRYSFGHNIYQNNGTHGCVNSPLNLAKKIYENIEAGTPVICYKE